MKDIFQRHFNAKDAKKEPRKVRKDIFHYPSKETPCGLCVVALSAFALKLPLKFSRREKIFHSSILKFASP
jgi:hypothetical protein